MKQLLVVTGGGDCPGLNAVIRAIVKRSSREKDWRILGSIEAFNGILREPEEIVILDEKTVAGIHFQGGTILQTTNVGGPFAWPEQQPDGSWTTRDRSVEMINKIRSLGIEGVINIGGDGSQRISNRLRELGLNIIGVPKTIDNDLSATDTTFGFQTAIQVATEAVDKLVTTAASHNRVFILEVMGRDAGWIAMHAAVAGGAEICLIPEIPYHLDKVMERIESRFTGGRGFAIIVAAEGARPAGGSVSAIQTHEAGNEHIRLGGLANRLAHDLQQAGCLHSIRVTVLGHLQRGGVPVAYDRILASRFGVKAFEMAASGAWGKMVSYRHPEVTAVPLPEAIREPKLVKAADDLLSTARGLGISFGD
ncbi:MAG TPA: ATP-dependent 6-phosphofructokinase [Bacteroidales bacterium]|nr:ATP-dependent 6-phosphofructokinase [Bacteroidales bacterium]